MTPQEKAQLDAQIKEIQDNTKKSENRNGKITIWVLGLATVSGIGNVAQGIAIKGLTPLKQPVPMIAVIDSETGIMTSVEKFDSTTDPKLIEKLVTSYFWDLSAIAMAITAKLVKTNFLHNTAKLLFS
jgi:type IV secretion system protein VirB8